MKKVLAIFLALTMCLSTVAFAVTDLNATVDARKEGGSVNVSATYMNTSNSIVPIWVFTGIYNEDGTVKDVEIEGSFAQPNMYKAGTKVYSYALAESESAKSFLWDKDTIYAYAPAGTAVSIVEKNDAFGSISITKPVMPEGYILGLEAGQTNKYGYYNASGEWIGYINDVAPATAGVLATGSNDFTYTLTNGAWQTISAVDGALYVDQSLSTAYTPGNIDIDFAPVSEGVVTISFDTKITTYMSHQSALNFASLLDSDGKYILTTNLGNGGLYNFAAGVSQTSNFAGTKLLNDTKSWHNIKYVVSLEEKTVDMYIDDVLKGEYPFYNTDSTEVCRIKFVGTSTSQPTSICNKYYIDNLKITNTPVYDSVEAATGLLSAAVGDMATGQITQYDLEIAEVAEAAVEGEEGFDEFGASSVATGKTTVTVDGTAGTARQLSAVATLTGEAEEYGFVVNGEKYEALTEVSENGKYGIQLFNVEGGVDYTVKPYSVDTNGTVTYGPEYTTQYKGTDWSVENFTNFNLNTPDFSGYTQTEGKDEWADKDGNTYTIDKLPVTITPVTTESYFDYTFNNAAYLVTEMEDGMLLVNGQSTPVKVAASNINIGFEPITEGKVEISYRYKLASRQNGTPTFNFGLFMDNSTGIRAGGAHMTQYGKVMIKTKRDSAAATNCTEITDVNGTLGEVGALLADKDDFNWHTMKYIVDVDNQNYQVYFDGIYAGEFNFITDYKNGEVKATSIDSLSFTNVGGASSASSVSSNGYNFYLDDVKVIQLY